MRRSVNARRLAETGPLPPRGVYPQETDVKEKKERNKMDVRTTSRTCTFLIPRSTKDFYDCRIIFHNDDSHVALALYYVFLFFLSWRVWLRAHKEMMETCGWGCQVSLNTAEAALGPLWKRGLGFRTNSVGAPMRISQKVVRQLNFL
jgi:hypothetical protein